MEGQEQDRDEPRDETIEDLDVDQEAAENVGGGAPDVSRPPSPPSGPVPIPYPNIDPKR